MLGLDVTVLEDLGTGGGGGPAPAAAARSGPFSGDNFFAPPPPERPPGSPAEVAATRCAPFANDHCRPARHEDAPMGTAGGSPLTEIHRDPRAGLARGGDSGRNGQRTTGTSRRAAAISRSLSQARVSS